MGSSRELLGLAGTFFIAAFVFFSSGSTEGDLVVGGTNGFTWAGACGGVRVGALETVLPFRGSVDFPHSLKRASKTTTAPNPTNQSLQIDRDWTGAGRRRIELS